MRRYIRPLLIIFLIIAIDQLIKIWIKANLYLGDEIPLISDKFVIHFTENNGMAFGFEFGGYYGKLILSLFRIVAVSFIGYALFRLIRQRYAQGLIICVSMILAGAIGNIIDSTFYGVAYGYADLFYGRVVDMFYAPLFTGVFPDWMPLWAGEEFLFFRPVFNFADASISVGVFVILLFQKTFFREPLPIVLTTNDEVEEE